MMELTHLLNQIELYLISNSDLPVTAVLKLEMIYLCAFTKYKKHSNEIAISTFNWNQVQTQKKKKNLIPIKFNKKCKYYIVQNI